MKRKPLIIEEAGVRVRLYVRGTLWWADVRTEGRRNRVPLKTSIKATAINNARALAKEVAKHQLLGVTPATLTLGELFTAYRHHRMPLMQPPRVRESNARIAMFTEAWGDDFRICDIDKTRVDTYCTARRSLKIVAPGLRRQADGTSRRGFRTPRPLRDGALYGELSWLSSVINWACSFRVNGSRLLTENPLHGLELPKEKNPRRPVASTSRYDATQRFTDTVDPHGRLRCILALARYTGRRESAICALSANDLLFSSARIREALAAAGRDEREAEKMPYGAIRWRAEFDKQGFLFVTPISEQMRSELDAYLARTPRIGAVPLFPAPGTHRVHDRVGFKAGREVAAARHSAEVACSCRAPCRAAEARRRRLSSVSTTMGE